MLFAAARVGAAGATGGSADAIAAVAADNAAQGAAGAGDASVKGIAKGMKGIVEVAGKLGVELTAAAPAGNTNADAGNLFAGDGNANGTIAHVGKAVDAVSKVSGKQILKAIVDSADEAGAAPGDARSPIAAAIGAAGGNAGDFANGMERDDKIAAAIVLRGMAASGKFAHGADNGGNAGIKKGMKIAVESAVGKISELIKEMVDAAKEGAGGATGAAGDEIAAVAAAGDAQAAVAANDASVKGIAKGMKGIVDAAGKLGVKLAADAAAGDTNGAAGNLFAGAGANNAGIENVGKAADAVSKVSGKQILKAIVDSAEENGAAGAAPGAATSPIAAAIGGGEAANFAANGMDRDDKIAAAIVLRGMAASGKFAHAQDNGGANGIKKGMKIAVGTGATGGAGDDIAAVAAANGAQAAVAADDASVKGIAKGMKGIVEVAGKLGVELTADAAAGNTNGDAGHLFAGNGANGTIANVGKAADAVSKVSGKQILKAIVESAEENGAAPAAATSPIAAAIGAGGAAGDFTNGMDRDDKIAAAIVLRGMAASGKFAHGADDNGAAGIKKGMKIAVESAVKKISGLIKEMIAAAKEGAAGATGAAAEDIAAVDAAAQAQAAVAANDASVKGIAKGMKGIVEVAGKLGVELAAGAPAGTTNAAAGHLFASNAATIVHVGNAADAVSKVSGKQILKAIVDSDVDAAAGAAPDQARSPIAAAIGAGGNGGDAGNFANGMERDDKIAAAIVLRGMAANGKFAHGADNNGDAGIKKGMKIAVESAVGKISGLIKEMIAAAKEGATGATGAANDEIAAVAGNGAQAAVAANDASVKGIAKGMKGIVDAAGKLGVELTDADAPAGNTNGDAGHLFAGDGGANIAQIGNAADAVSKVSGKQILKAIVDSAEENGAQPADAASPIAAAIGGAGNNGGAAGDFTAANGNMDRDDKIAAAIVLRGMAASGKFAHGQDNGGANGIKKGMKIAVGKISGLIKEMIAAAKEGAGGATGAANDEIAAVAGNGAQAAVAANDASVKGIAKGMKGIVDAAGKLGVELTDADAVAGVANAAAGNLFAGDGGANIAQIGKAADAVSKVSGKQILKAIVDSAEENGAQPADAASPIAAAIGGGGNAGDFANGMERDDKIAAAIVLRGILQQLMEIWIGMIRLLQLLC